MCLFECLFIRKAFPDPISCGLHLTLSKSLYIYHSLKIHYLRAYIMAGTELVLSRAVSAAPRIVINTYEMFGDTYIHTHTE